MTALERGGGGVPAAFFLPSSSDFSPLCIISVSCSLSFALKSDQLPGFLFMSPGSDALASKLCKCILPVKLKPSLLVLRGLLHRVLHHSFGSGPYISHRNESADGSTSSLPSHLPTCLSALSARAPPSPGDPRRRRAGGRTYVCGARFNSTDEDITAQLGTEEFLQQTRRRNHAGSCGVSLGGASDGSLIIQNVSSLWAESSETRTEYTLPRRRLNLKAALASRLY